MTDSMIQASKLYGVYHVCQTGPSLWLDNGYPALVQDSLPKGIILQRETAILIVPPGLRLDQIPACS